MFCRTLIARVLSQPAPAYCAIKAQLNDVAFGRKLTPRVFARLTVSPQSTASVCGDNPAHCRPSL